MLCASPLPASSEPSASSAPSASAQVMRAVKLGQEASLGELSGRGWRLWRQDGGWSCEGAAGVWSASSCEVSAGELVCRDVVFRLGGRVGVSQGLRQDERGSVVLMHAEMARIGAARGARVEIERATLLDGAWQRFEGLKRESKKERR